MLLTILGHVLVPLAQATLLIVVIIGERRSREKWPSKREASTRAACCKLHIITHPSDAPLYYYSIVYKLISLRGEPVSCRME